MPFLFFILTSVNPIFAHKHTYGEKIDNMKKMNTILDAIYEFKEQTGVFPLQLTDLTSYLQKIPKDPWNHDYVFVSNGHEFSLFTLGADRKEGGRHSNMDIVFKFKLHESDEQSSYERLSRN